MLLVFGVADTLCLFLSQALYCKPNQMLKVMWIKLPHEMVVWTPLCKQDSTAYPSVIWENACWCSYAVCHLGHVPHGEAFEVKISHHQHPISCLCWMLKEHNHVWSFINILPNNWLELFCCYYEHWLIVRTNNPMFRNLKNQKDFFLGRCKWLVLSSRENGLPLVCQTCEQSGVLYCGCP